MACCIDACERCSFRPSSVQCRGLWLCTPAAGLLRLLLLSLPLLLPPLLLLYFCRSCCCCCFFGCRCCCCQQGTQVWLLSQGISSPALLFAGERARHLPRHPLRHHPGERGVRRGGAERRARAAWVERLLHLSSGASSPVFLPVKGCCTFGFEIARQSCSPRLVFHHPLHRRALWTTTPTASPRTLAPRTPSSTLVSLGYHILHKHRQRLK